MMNADIMRQLVAEAESGDKTMPTARTAASLWGYDDGSLKDFRYSANAIYTFKQNGIQRFMRLIWAGDKPIELIEAELDYLEFLEKQLFPVVQPISSLRGQRIEDVANAYARFYAVTFNAAQGAYKDSDTLTRDEIEVWGAMLGRLHLLSEIYQPSPAYQRPAWKEVMQSTLSWIPDKMPNFSRYMEEAKTWLATLPLDQTSYGLIHWDFEPDNMTWHDTGVEVYDFDDAAYFWYPADIAFALDDVLKQPAPQARTIIQHFLKGYQRVRDLNPEWIQSLPFFVRLMRALKTARICRAFTGTHAELDPPWLAQLRERLMDVCTKNQPAFNQPFTVPLSAAESEIWEVHEL